MEAREKAKQLVQNFSLKLPWYNEKNNLNKSKQCALIVVNEIINYLAIIEQISGSYNGDYYFNYWQEVKQEIEKL